MWFCLMFVMIHLRRRQRVQNHRDIAESIEDAKIYAESLNQVKPCKELYTQPTTKGRCLLKSINDNLINNTAVVAWG